MNTNTLSFTSRIVNPDSVLLRLMMYPGEVYRLPEAGQRVRVEAGQAWLTYESRDVFLGECEDAQLPVSQTEAVLISAEGGAPALVEILN